LDETAFEPHRPYLWAEVGRVAGEIWRYLDRHGETSTLKLRSALKIPQSLLFLSLGWLAREDKVQIVSEDRGYLVSLKPSL
jgi:hypothetical protein